MIFNQNRKFFKYIRNFGLFYGLKLFYTIRRSKSQKTVKFKIPGLNHPIFMRRVSSDFSVFEEIFVDNQYSFLDRKDASYLIDAGANIGLAALFLIKQYPNATIICIEPEIENYAILLQNTKHYKSIICINKALWSVKTNLMIKNSSADSWGFEIIESKDTSGTIPSITIQDIIEEFDLKKIDVLKIDIEGSEKEVFTTGSEWIDKVECVIVEIHENMRAGAHESVMSLMSKKNYNYKSNHPLYIFNRQF